MPGKHPNALSHYDSMEIDREAKTQRAMEMRREGKQYSEISAELGVTRDTARHYILRARNMMRERTIDDAEKMRSEMADELEFVMEGLIPWVAKGDPPSSMAYIRAVEQLSKLYGLYKPVVVAKDDKKPIDRQEIIDYAVRLATAGFAVQPQETDGTTIVDVVARDPAADDMSEMSEDAMLALLIAKKKERLRKKMQGGN